MYRRILLANSSKILNSFKHLSSHTSSKFSGAKRGSFTQQAPSLGNQYEDDAFLRESLLLEMPAEIFQRQIEPDLLEFGHRVSTNIYKLHLECEKYQPHLGLSDHIFLFYREDCLAILILILYHFRDI